ncbi:nuclear transport factor 2 family protein [Flavobacterium sp. CYK-4]|uniref:nuclear transport factor 2 family protein n=1 Tax=Flavobacterium lotistagni TaxID=2709660 RepID=UPI00140A204B|nr:nuclear transport factor 2 family protein [Flavobacterium lotistagni]NHM07441.1 nuclear transport factor 2 family protein [Flavobacterium lotistagni]
MKIKIIFLVTTLALLQISCSSSKNNYQITKKYQPDDEKLYREIVAADSIFFNAYNTCEKNLDTYAAYFLDDIEFYHDKGGLMTSKPELVQATKKNVCGKVTRELVKGSIEVYPIKNFGAIEMGLHQFHNSAEPDAVSKPARFMIVWKFEAQQWKISRVVSLH